MRTCIEHTPIKYSHYNTSIKIIISKIYKQLRNILILHLFNLYYFSNNIPHYFSYSSHYSPLFSNIPRGLRTTKTVSRRYYIIVRKCARFLTVKITDISELKRTTYARGSPSDTCCTGVVYPTKIRLRF